jgi:hypothetical protein
VIVETVIVETVIVETVIGGVIEGTVIVETVIGGVIGGVIVETCTARQGPLDTKPEVPTTPCCRGLHEPAACVSLLLAHVSARGLHEPAACVRLL